MTQTAPQPNPHDDALFDSSPTSDLDREDNWVLGEEDNPVDLPTSMSDDVPPSNFANTDFAEVSPWDLDDLELMSATPADPEITEPTSYSTTSEAVQESPGEMSPPNLGTAIAFAPVPSLFSPAASPSPAFSPAPLRFDAVTPALPKTHASNPVVVWWHKLNLTHKAMVAATLMGVVPVLTLGGIAYTTVDSTVRQQVQEILQKENIEVKPQSLERQSSHSLGLGLLLGAIATAGLTSTIAVLLANRATRPLRQISQSVQKIGQGDLDSQVEIEGEDEFAVLGTQINAMTQRIKHLVQDQALNIEQVNLLAEVASSLTPDRQALTSTLNQALGGVRRILQADRVVIYQFNADYSGTITYESLEIGWSSAFKEMMGDPCIPAALIEGYRQGRVVATDDVRNAGFHPDHLQLMVRLEIQSNLVVPILNQGKVYGLLIAHHCAQPHRWQEGEVNFLKQLADQIGITLDRISLQEQRRDDTKRAQKLKDITLAIATALNSSSVFDLAVREVRQAIASDRVIIYRFNPDWSGRIIAESVIDPYPKALGADIADPCFAQRYVDKYKQGRVQATANIHDAGLTDCHLKQLEPFAVKANLVAPILYKGELLGLLVAHQCSGTRAWEQAEIDFFAQIATQVGLSLERTALIEQQRLSEEEQRKAREILQKRALDLLLEVDPVSRGDLTIRAHVTEDEIGTIADSYNAMIESLRRIVSQVQIAASQMSFTTSNNEAAVRQLSEEAQTQAHDVAIALDRIQAMSRSILVVATNAEQAETAVQQATQTVEAGEEAMNRTVDGIMAIRETVAETAKKVKRLGESSQKISKVVNLISSFADQTNLLALNASIEAAHAGEEGRGFAVVADEVRSLARQSAEATAEIEVLVATIQSETNEVVAAMEAGTEQVVVGTKLVDETRKSLNQITATSAQITELVEAIARAAGEQAQTSQMVTETMAQVASTSDKTSQEAGQVSESFKQLLAVAQSLQESVRQFKVQ